MSWLNRFWEISKSQVEMQDFASSLSAVDSRCSALEEREGQRGREDHVEHRRSLENPAKANAIDAGCLGNHC